MTKRKAKKEIALDSIINAKVYQNTTDLTLLIGAIQNRISKINGYLNDFYNRDGDWDEWEDRIDEVKQAKSDLQDRYLSLCKLKHFVEDENKEEGQYSFADLVTSSKGNQ